MNNGLPEYVIPPNDDPSGRKYLEWTIRNPCECLMNMEGAGRLRTASGISLLLEVTFFYEKLLSLPPCNPNRIERNSCMKQTLNLTIQRKWFDMIAQGIKTEEYRDCENRQVQRAYLWAANDHYWYESKPVAILRNGYRMDSRALVVKIVGFDLRGRENVKHPEWGEPKCRRLHIAVILSEVLFKGVEQSYYYEGYISDLISN